MEITRETLQAMIFYNFKCNQSDVQKSCGL